MGLGKRCGDRREAPSTDGASGRSLLVLAAIDTAAFVAAAWLCISVPESLEPSAGVGAPAAVAQEPRACQ
ncbi:MAG TPA: hypothetical protein VHP37_13315 [Burkholderiales bacterium]|nr:hypothetical protein [Burkholderiales bacterium]